MNANFMKKKIVDKGKYNLKCHMKRSLVFGDFSDF